MAETKTQLLQGTLDLLILRALQIEAMHGFGLSLRLRQMSQEVFQVEMGSLYPALCRLEAQGWIRGEWGVGKANGQRVARACFFGPSGRKGKGDGRRERAPVRNQATAPATRRRLGTTSPPRCRA